MTSILTFKVSFSKCNGNNVESAFLWFMSLNLCNVLRSDSPTLLNEGKCRTKWVKVIRQKGESRNGGNKKTKHAKFSEKRPFLTPWSARKKCLFFGKFDVLCFLVTSILRFALFLYYWRIDCCIFYITLSLWKLYFVMIAWTARYSLKKISSKIC